MTTYYRVDGARLSYAEYWRMSPSAIAFFIAAGRKLLGVPIHFNFAIPRPDRLFLVELEELPPPARRAMAPAIRSAEQAGLRLSFCRRLAVPEPHRIGAAALLLDDENQTSQMVVFGSHGKRRELRLACVSRFPDDTLATTTTMKKSLQPMPGFHIERYPDASPALIYAHHRGHLERLAAEGLIPVPFQPEKLEDFVLLNEVRYVDFHIGRGVFVPMTEDELDAAAGR
jgi:hypothetical protein